MTSAPNTSGADFLIQIEQQVRSLQALGAKNIYLNIVDHDVVAADPLRITRNSTPINAMVSLWVNANVQAADISKTLKSISSTCHAYLVSESEPLPNTEHPPVVSQRTYGMNQIALLEIPPRLTTEEWLDLWQKDHTTVAIDTQATFGYIQNWVIRSLTKDAPKIDAIVEESFPPECMTDRQAFFASPNNQSQYKEREQRMIQSCARFIDFDKMECYPMSQYYLAQ